MAKVQAIHFFLDSLTTSGNNIILRTLPYPYGEVGGLQRGGPQKATTNN